MVTSTWLHHSSHYNDDRQLDAFLVAQSLLMPYYKQINVWDVILGLLGDWCDSAAFQGG